MSSVANSVYVVISTLHFNELAAISLNFIYFRPNQITTYMRYDSIYAELFKLNRMNFSKQMKKNLSK